MISIRNITKHFEGPDILKNVSLDIEDGEAVVIIGGSGCGKSTLLRCINRLTVPDEGQVLIDGEDIHEKGADVDGIRRNMGMVYQHFNLFSHLNVLENIIEAPVRVLKMKKEDAIQEAFEYLRMVGLEQKAYHMPQELSGGQKQRVAIARTLAMHPKYILFDEPTSALDPTMVDEVEHVIRDLVESGITSVIVTHEMRFAKSIASRVVFLAEQGIYEEGTPEEIFDHPKKQLTRTFLYNSRTKKIDAVKGFDVEGAITELKGFLNHYEHTTKQMDLFRVAMDELVLPRLNAGDYETMEIRLICSENDTKHKLFIRGDREVKKEDTKAVLDDITKAIVRKYFTEVSITSDEGKDEIILDM